MAATVAAGDRTHEFERDASEYDATRHALNRMRDRKMLTPEMAAEAIEEGMIHDANVSDRDNICVTLHHDWGVLKYEVVVDIERKRVVTICDRGRDR